MKREKIEMFIELAGQIPADSLHIGSESQRALGAQLLLSEVLEYVIKGLGITPVVNGVEITEPDSLEYRVSDREPDKLEMIDGLADVAYTMFWNAVTFGVPLEQAFELVCDNNLEKFVSLDEQIELEIGELPSEKWGCGKDVAWPDEVSKVEVIKIANKHFAVGKDQSGKVRKPLHFQPVRLESLVNGR